MNKYKTIVSLNIFMDKYGYCKYTDIGVSFPITRNDKKILDPFVENVKNLINETNKKLNNL